MPVDYLVLEALLPKIPKVTAPSWIGLAQAFPVPGVSASHSQVGHRTFATSILSSISIPFPLRPPSCTKLRYKRAEFGSTAPVLQSMNEHVAVLASVWQQPTSEAIAAVPHVDSYAPPQP